MKKFSIFQVLQNPELEKRFQFEKFTCLSLPDFDILRIGKSKCRENGKLKSSNLNHFA